MRDLSRKFFHRGVDKPLLLTYVYDGQSEMKKSIEFKLRTSSAHQRLLLKLLDKGKGIYNLGLSECKKRLNRLRSDKEYQTFNSLRHDLKRANLPTRQVDQLLRDIVTKRYFLTKTDIEKYVKDNAGYLITGFNSQFAQTLADRAFDTIQKVLYGKSKKVRFKGKWDNILASVNSKSTDTGIMFDSKSFSISYMGVSIPLVLDYRKDDGYHKWYLEQIVEDYEKHKAFNVSYIRIVRRVIKGHDVFYVQFVINVRPIGMTDEKAKQVNLTIAEHNQSLISKSFAGGNPTNRLRLKHAVSSIIEFPTGNKTVEMIRELGLYGQFQSCIDMGPKHFAAFLRGEHYSIAILQPIFDRLKEYADELRILQRKLDRQRRANNPDNYNTNGMIRKGKCLRWKRSQGYIETNNRIKELYRLITEMRKSAIRELSSIIAALSKKVSAEDLSYKTLQKNYGRSVGNFAPSYFMKDIFSKAESAGNENVEIPLIAALSQLCVCGARKKKKLSERLHECNCWCLAQRDVLSAYLGTYYVPNPGEWEGSDPARQYHSEDRLLLTASHRVYPSQTASRRGQGIGFALGLDKRPSSGSCGKTGEYPSENSVRKLMVCKDLKSLIGELGSLSSRILGF